MAFRARSGRDLLCRCCCWKANGSCSLSVRCQLIGSSEWIARTSVLAMLQVQARLQHAPLLTATAALCKHTDPQAFRQHRVSCAAD